MMISLKNLIFTNNVSVFIFLIYTKRTRELAGMVCWVFLDNEIQRRLNRVSWLKKVLYWKIQYKNPVGWVFKEPLYPVEKFNGIKRGMNKFINCSGFIFFLNKVWFNEVCLTEFL